MKHAPQAVMLVAFAIASFGCDSSKSTKPGGGNPPPSSTPVATAPGTPAGAPAMGTIGAGGGMLASSDGLFRLEVPAGALSANTDITVQPITNTAWGGVGRAYRLTPVGLTFTATVGVVFSLEDSLLAGSDPAVVDVAVQGDDGVWGVLSTRDVDVVQGTITCRTSHFSDYSMIEGIQLQPGGAIVNVNQSIPLRVRFCSRDILTDGNEEVAALLISCADDLAPLGTFENWSVNGLVGGNSVVGHVSPTSGLSVTYSAPDEEPTPNHVAVSVETSFEGQDALLVCNVQIRGAEQWVGSCTAYMGGDVAVATVTWVLVGSFGSIKFFMPTGFVEYTIDPKNCQFVSLDPDTWLIGDTDGTLLIDYSQDPPTFTGGAGTYWDAEHCFVCDPETGTECVDATFGAGWFADKGEVTEDGTRIEGILVDDDLVPYLVYGFTKQVAPPRLVAGR